MAASPQSAYIHVPFCRHHCGYCNFTVIAGREDLAERYLDALAAELTLLQRPRPVNTIFIGGGTPTHLNLPQLERLITSVQQWFPLGYGGEFSVEANPRDALDVEKLRLLKVHGVTRISLGAQSFHEDKLRILERDHDAVVIRQAVESVQSLNMDVALDLIFGTPGETLAGWHRDLEQAIALAPKHISTYGLTFEKGTTFWGRLTRGELVQADEELERAMYELAIDTLTAARYEHYEVSNFARPEYRCRHNEAYWLGHEYFAAGPGAARYVAGRRETNHRSTTAWMQRVLSGDSPVAESETLSSEEQARERLVFGLRRLEGIDLADFAARFGYTVDALAGAELARFVEQGLLQRAERTLRLTRAGLLISDAIWPYLLS
jgi:oxygen-independent coproporphyrinogen-3 oxidase